MEPEYRSRQARLARVDVYRLEFAKEGRLRVDREVEVRDGDASPPLPRNALFHFSFERVAVVFVGRNVHEARLRVVGLEWPVLATPKARAELRGLAGCRLVSHVDFRPAVSLSMLVKTFCGTYPWDLRYEMLPSELRFSQYR